MEGTEILRKNGLRLTQCRNAIIEVFCTSNMAIGHAELDSALMEQEFDRVTIYRTINTFLEKGIIHKVMDGSGVGKFALCSPKCDEHQHHDDHVHFSCIKCGNTTCMEDLLIPQLTLPQGYEVKEAALLLKGTCGNCKRN